MSAAYLTAMLGALRRLRGGLSLEEVIFWAKTSPQVHLSKREVRRLIARLARESV